MRKIYVLLICFLLVVAGMYMASCNAGQLKSNHDDSAVTESANPFYLDSAKIPSGKYGDAIRYGRDLIMRTAYLIGPDGMNGRYTNNKMNCTNCHQDGGTKPYSFNLQTSFRRYPESEGVSISES